MATLVCCNNVLPFRVSLIRRIKPRIDTNAQQFPFQVNQYRASKLQMLRAEMMKLSFGKPLNNSPKSIFFALFILTGYNELNRIFSAVLASLRFRSLFRAAMMSKRQRGRSCRVNAWR